MKKLIFLSLLSNLLFACGSYTGRVPVPLIWLLKHDGSTHLGYTKFIPEKQSDNEDKIVAVVVNGANHYSENYGTDIAEKICSTLGMECILPDRRGCGMSDSLEQSFYAFDVSHDFHNMLSILYPKNTKFVLVGHSTGQGMQQIWLYRT